MFRDGAAVQHHEAVSTPGPRRGCVADREEAFVGEVVEDEDLAVGHALRVQVFPHAFVDGNDVLSERIADFFLDAKEPDQDARRAVVPAHVELGHGIVHVQDHLAAAQSGNDRREHQEVGHVMDVDEVITPGQ